MLKAMFKPFFKKFFGLFISMTFVSLLAIALLSCFGSAMSNLKHTYENYIVEYANLDEQVSIKSFTKRETLLSVKDLEEVQEVDARLTIDCYLKKENLEENKSRTIVARIFSFNEKENVLFKRYVTESVTPSTDHVNVSVTSKFAKNNNFQVGKTIKLGFFGLFEEFYISEIVETVEGIYPRANDYVWSDNQDFGYIYVSEAELSRGLTIVADKIVKKIDEDASFREYYEKAVAVSGITLPDFRTIEETFVSRYANQIIVKNVEGQDEQTVLNKIEEKLNSEGVEIKSSTVASYLPYRLYMQNVVKQLNVASTFLPIFFYSITMVVIGLFMNQIIKTMTPQIGVFVSIGISKKEIITLFIIYAAAMALTAGLLGGPAGYGLCVLLVSIMRSTYSMPMIPDSLQPVILLIAIAILVACSVLATFLSCLSIFKITPKDATISNEAKRKPLPKWISRFIDKAPMNIKLGTNSIMQNPKRFFVSSFSIFASLVLILLSSFFWVSKDEMISQSVERRLNFDAQIYLTQKEEQSFIDDLAMQSFMDEMEDCYYTYLKANNKGGSDVYLECLAIDVDGTDSGMITIPDEKGINTTSISQEGIILPKSAAEQLNVNKGDTIFVNGREVTVTAISFQYFHPITFLSKAQMDAFGVDYVTSIILNLKEGQEQALLDYLSENKNQCLTVFTESLSKDLHGNFDSVNIMIAIMVAFSVGMAFIILSIMSQNALMEQQRQLTILRAIGFRIFDISNFWTLQSVAQMISSAIFAIPAGVGVTLILLNSASSASQTYPFIFSWPVVFMALGFVLLVLIICHLLAMFSIRKWNIANNTRCRE